MALLAIVAIVVAISFPEIRIAIGLDPHVLKPVALPLTESDSPLKIDSLIIDNPFDAESYWQGNHVIIYYNYRNGNGKIVIDGRKYSLDRIEVDKSDGSGILTGSKVAIMTSKLLYDEESGGDCIYGNFSKVSITFNGTIYTLKDIMLQNCPSENVFQE